MALPELFANPATPGSAPSQLTTLSAAITTTSATTFTTNAAAPAALQGTGQFRILIDAEIMITTAGANGTTWTVTRGAEGTTAATHSSGAAIYHLLTAGSMGGQSDPAAGVPGLRTLGTGATQAAPGDDPVPRDGRQHYQPGHTGNLLASVDPAICTSNFTPATKFIYVSKMWVPATVSVTNLQVYVQGAGATLTSGQNLAGIYNSSGGLVASTADQSTNWTSTGLKTMALTGGPYNLTGGAGNFCWAAILSVGTTIPRVSCTPTSSVVAHPGRGSTYATTVPGALHRTAYESVGNRTSLVSLNGLTLTDVNDSIIIWFACT